MHRIFIGRRGRIGPSHVPGEVPQGASGHWTTIGVSREPLSNPLAGAVSEGSDVTEAACVPSNQTLPIPKNQKVSAGVGRSDALEYWVLAKWELVGSPAWRLCDVCVRAFCSFDLGVNVVKVRPRGNESIQQMLKRFKRLCQREGLTRDMKRHSYYEKPSERKRRQMRKAIRKIEKDRALAGCIV